MAKQGDGGISWTDDTWNPIRGCTRVSEGCRNCYAERVAARFSGEGMPYEGVAKLVRLHDGRTVPRWTGKLSLVEDAVARPIRWQRPRLVFVNSMSDLFHEAIPSVGLDRLFAVMALAPQHTFQILTKRHDRMRAYLGDPAVAQRVWTAADEFDRACSDGPSLKLWALGRQGAMWGGAAPWPLRNIWLGVSVEDQAAADERVPLLLATPAAVRWVSAEPLLAYVRLDKLRAGKIGEMDALRGSIVQRTGQYTAALQWDEGDYAMPMHRRLDWVVAGGESGPGARITHPAWAKSLRDQCVSTGVPFHYKQWGEWAPCAAADWHGRGPAGKPAQLAIGPDGRTAGGFLTDELALRREAEGWVPMARIGKTNAGRLLDGKLWNQYPGQVV